MNVEELKDALYSATANSDYGVARYEVVTSDEYREVPLAIDGITIDHENQKVIIGES